MNGTGSFDDSRVSVRARLATMWVVIMFFYIYNDIFMLLRAVRSGADPSDPPTQLKLLIYAIIITPAALMPLLCIVLRPALARWVNIVIGAIYFALIVWTIMPAGTSWFYRYIGIVENIITLAMIWTAWRWPRQELAEPL